MKIDYIEIIKDSFNLTWNNKVLWIYGFILAFFAGGSGLNNVSNNSNSSTMNSTENMSREFANFASSPAFWPIVFVSIVLFITYILVSFYLSGISIIAINRSVKLANTGMSNQISFGHLWNDSQRVFFWKYFVFVLIWIAVLLVLSILLIAPIAFMIVTLGPVAVLLLCCLLILISPILIVFGLIYSNAMVFLTYYDYGVIDSIKEGWNIIKKDWVNYLLGVLFSILVNLTYTFVIFIVAIILAIPALFLTTLLNNTPFGIAMLVLASIVLGLVYAVVGAPFIAFAQVYWTKFIVALKEA